MENIEKALIKAGRTAGEILRKNSFSYGKLEWKKLDDPVTAMDKSTEHLIKKILRKEAPGNFLGEEYGFEDNKLDLTYIIDPIDGTKSFILRDFLSAVSIGVEENGKIKGGLVYDFMKDIMYVGYKGTNYILFDGNKYEFKDKHDLSKPRIICNKTNGLKERLEEEGFSVNDLTGSLALNLTEIAAGNKDGAITGEIGKGAIWDIAGAYYFLKNKGFVTLDFYGNEFNHKEPNKGFIILRQEITDK